MGIGDYAAPVSTIYYCQINTVINEWLTGWELNTWLVVVAAWRQKKEEKEKREKKEKKEKREKRSNRAVGEGRGKSESSTGVGRLQLIINITEPNIHITDLQGFELRVAVKRKCMSSELYGHYIHLTEHLRPETTWMFRQESFFSLLRSQFV